MKYLIDLLSDYIGQQVERSVKSAIAPAVPFVRGVAVGLACIVASAPLFVLGSLAVGGAIFAGLAGYGHFVAPALWTALIFWVLGGIVLSIGFSLARRPR